MTSTRSYRRALSQETAFAELRDGAGTQFNGECVEALISAIETPRRALRRRSRGRRARVGGGSAGSRAPVRPASVTSWPRARSRGAGGRVVRRWARVLVLVLGGAAVAVGIEIAHPGSPVGAARGHRWRHRRRRTDRAEATAARRRFRSPSRSWSCWRAQASVAGRGARARDRRARHVPGSLGTDIGRRAAWRCSSNDSSRASPRCSCSTAWPTRSARRPTSKLLFALAVAARRADRDRRDRAHGA